MPLKQGLGFASDQLNVLIGFDGSEPKELLQWISRHAGVFPCRIACAINQHYPELKSGFFLNRSLIALIQDALKEVGCHVVIEDHYQEHGLVPEEVSGGLEAGDDYLIVDASLRILGRLNAWESYGGQGEFHHDRFIVDILCDASRAEELLARLEQTCQSNAVAFSSRFGTEKPQSRGSVFKRMLRCCGLGIL